MMARVSSLNNLNSWCPSGHQGSIQRPLPTRQSLRRRDGTEFFAACPWRWGADQPHGRRSWPCSGWTATDGLGRVEVRGVSRQSVKLRPNHILAGEVRQSRGQVDADIRLPIGFPYHHSLLVSVHRLARGNSDRTIRVGASASILSVIQGSMKMPSRLAESIVVGANRYSGAAGSVQGAA